MELPIGRATALTVAKQLPTRSWSALAFTIFAFSTYGHDWYPSEHGADDTLGAVNHLTPEGVVRAAKLVKTGKTYPLGVVTGWETPAYPPRHYAITVIQPGQDNGPTMGANLATGNDDLLYTWMGIGSQLDGLGHMGINHEYYNGLTTRFRHAKRTHQARHPRNPAHRHPRRAARHDAALRRQSCPGRHRVQHRRH